MPRKRHGIYVCLVSRRAGLGAPRTSSWCNIHVLRLSSGHMPKARIYLYACVWKSINQWHTCNIVCLPMHTCKGDPAGQSNTQACRSFSSSVVVASARGIVATGVSSLIFASDAGSSAWRARLTVREQGICSALGCLNKYTIGLFAGCQNN